ncbi:MAG: aminoacetone oxidase family FAD-binding enzyme [Cellulosilyticaceae bacterium]
MKTIGIVGGGASGLVAGIVAARTGAKVLIIEKQNRIGKKILMTGNGRCNITNTYVEKKHFHTSSKVDFYNPIYKMDEVKILEFFEELGIISLIENNKVYPLSEQAASVLDVLRIELERLGAAIITDTRVVDLYAKQSKWHIVGEHNEEGKHKYQVDKVIVATGGMAGITLDCGMYEILKSLGHKMQPIFPTLVHIVSSSKYCKMMQGTRVKGAISIYVKGKLARSESGEVLFTEDGLSGPPIFQLSRIASECEAKHKACEVKLDLCPNISEEDMIGMMYERIGKNPDKTIEEMFIGWMHKRVVIPVIKDADIGSSTTLCQNLDYDMILRLVQSIKGLRFEVKGTRSFKFAQSTAGGIDLEGVDFETMESKVASGLYMTGELLDVDGDCGGYNLQWAWSTGYLAGKSAAR